MKINKNNPWHWCYLIAFALQALLGLALRPFLPRSTVILYGHKLNGNLLALQRRYPTAAFLTMDRHYARQLQARGIRSQWACGFKAAMLLARSRALISSHGLHSLEILLPAYRKAGLKCIDVWHGIPFKGFDAKDFRLQLTYDEIWVASPSQRALWIEKFGFSPENVYATGYARTDQLVQQVVDTSAAKRQLGLNPATCGKTVLFAPTWAQDEKGRSIYPFGSNEQEFLAMLSTFATQHGATILLRNHLNSETIAASSFPNMVSLPSSDNPDTESILLASDILVCDWSSIAFDFLLLDRPTLFLDVPPPFYKGLSLGPEYRFGAIAHNTQEMLKILEICATRANLYWKSQAIRHHIVRQEVYGESADGHATKRCIARLEAIHVARN